MNCELAETTIHGYFDGELDAVRSAEFERHLEHCSRCQAALEGIESLRTQLQQSDLYERASPELREKVRKQIAQETTSEVRLLRGSSWKRWFLLAGVRHSSGCSSIDHDHAFRCPVAHAIDAHCRTDRRPRAFAAARTLI